MTAGVGARSWPGSAHRGNAEVRGDFEGEHPAVSAADAIWVQITDQGVQVANRTSYSVRLEIELVAGSPDATEPPVLVQGLRLELGPREGGLIPQEKLGEASALTLPRAVTRQWSHDQGVVYEGGELAPGLVRVVFLEGSGATDTARANDGVADTQGLSAGELGQVERVGGAALGVLITAKEIKNALASIWRD